MVGPVRIDGLFSGIDYTSIIEKLLAGQRLPITRLQGKVSTADKKKAALLQLNANLLALKGIANTLSRPSFFNATQVSSSNEGALKATGTSVGSLGAFNFSVRRLATAHQVLSNGFADSNTTAVTTSAATVTLEIGGGAADRVTLLNDLNGGSGVDRGIVQITDSAGKVALVDLEGAVTVSDVLSAINNQTQANVRASLTGDRLVVRDLAGGAPGAFTIVNYGSDTSATDLGIAGTGVAGPGGNYIYGGVVQFLSGTTSQTKLNDGLGVRRNADGSNDFSVTGPDGITFNVDLQSADQNVSQILSRINSAASAAGSSVVASIAADGASLQLLGAGAAGYTIAPLGGSFAAVDLGFGNYVGSTFVEGTEENATTGAPAPGTGARLVGNRVLPTLNSTLRNLTNGGQTHSTAPVAVTAAAALGATTISVSGPGGLSVGDRIRIVEGAVTQIRRVTNLSGSTVTIDQGLSSAITPAATLSDLQGTGDGTVTFTDRSGASFSVDLSSRISTTTTAAAGVGATSVTLASAGGFSVGNRIRIVDGGLVQVRTVTGIAGTTVSFDQGLTGAIGAGAGVITDHATLGQIQNTVNDRAAAAGVDIRLEVNSEGNGLQVVDFSGGTAALSVVDAGGTVAADLGISGSVSANLLNGTDLDVQYLSPATALSSLNSRAGVQPGKIRITDRSNIQFEVDLTQSNDTTLQAVISDINGAASAAGSALTARINNTGDGLVLIDTGAGTGTVRVEELGTTRTARDLNLLGSAPAGTPGILNASFERRISLSAGSTLDDVRNALNNAGLPITASIINDGGPTNPYRLSVLSKNSGVAGRLVLDSDIPALSVNTAAAAQDSVFLYGTNSGANDPMLLTSSSNRYTDVVPGLTLELQSVSSSNVTISVSRDLQGVQDQASEFVEKYNSVVQLMRELTFFDPDTLKKGILFSDPTVRRIRQELSSLITQPVTEIPSGNLRSLQELGFKVTQEGGLTLDSSKLSEKLNTSFSQVVDLFTRQRQLKLDTPVSDLNNGLGLKTVPGDDLRIRPRNATQNFTVDLSTATSIGSILSAINFAPGNNGAVTASLSSDGFSIVLSDNTSIPTRAVEGPTTATSFVESDADIDPLADGFLVGATVTFLTGANAGQVRKISAFSTATNTITLDSALPGAPAVGDTYRIERELEVEAVNASTAGDELKLVKKASLSQTQLIGGLINLKNDPGIGFRLGERLDVMTRSEDGYISIRTESLDDTIKGMNLSIERIEDRVEQLEARLVREFARLEVFVAQSQGTMGRLQSALSGLTSIIRQGQGANGG